MRDSYTKGFGRRTLVVKASQETHLNDEPFFLLRKRTFHRDFPRLVNPIGIVCQLRQGDKLSLGSIDSLRRPK